ncbi:MAG TPA: L-threonylcarbamoyladenylate synthase [Pirellulales bacterium]|nr:L-threonylcarbamoyladenylate synthase [Pirellulales bacterium]
MTTEVIPVDPRSPDPDLVARAAAVLRAGGLVAFPTETVYGLGANAFDAAAVARIFAAKGRPTRNPLIVHVAEVADVVRVAAEWPEVARRLAERFWPGPLTFVLSKHPDLPNVVTAGGGTVAVRLPAHPIARALIRAARVPLAAPSANPSARISATTAEHVLRHLKGRIEQVIDGGPTAGGLESTVLDVTCSPPVCLRPGLASLAAIEAVVGKVLLPDSADAERASAGDDGPALRSPGLLARHYAPRVPLELAAGNAWQRVRDFLSAGVHVGWLSLDEVVPDGLPEVTVVQMPTEPMPYAARLYAALHALEAAGVDRIVVSLPPEGEAWLAIHDRLQRAAVRD